MDMNAIVAGNIRKMRQDRGISLDELARLSGVSRSMLAQIERGDGNPTISTLWKISNGMGLPFDFLTARPETEYDIVHLADIQPLLEDEGKVRNYSLFPDNGIRGFAAYYLEYEKGSYFVSEPHLKGTEEFVTVLEGSVEITAGEHVFQASAPDSIRFRADNTHSYRNAGDGKARVYMIIYNP